MDLIRKETIRNINLISGKVDLEIKKQVKAVREGFKEEFTKGDLVKKITQRMRVQNTYVFQYGKRIEVKSGDLQAEPIRFTQGDEEMVKGIIEDKDGEYDRILDQVKGQIPNFTGVCSWGL